MGDHEDMGTPAEVHTWRGGPTCDTTQSIEMMDALMADPETPSRSYEPFLSCGMVGVRRAGGRCEEVRAGL